MFLGNPDRVDSAALLRAPLGGQWPEKKAVRQTKPVVKWVNPQTKPTARAPNEASAVWEICVGHTPQFGFLRRTKPFFFRAERSQWQAG
jgi:hypothetical protein